MASTVLLERLIVLDRGLTVHDEQADDEELRERVLFVWSAAQEEGPEEKAGRVSSIDDLRRLATVEGCIDFCKCVARQGARAALCRGLTGRHTAGRSVRTAPATWWSRSAP